MKIDTNTWSEFQIGGKNGLFEIINGKGITKAEIINHPGKILAIQSGSENNGCIGFIDEQYCHEHGYYIQYEPALTVARSGSSGHITYQEKPFVVGDSAKILKCKYNLTPNQFLFIKTLLMQIKNKYSYNNKVSVKKYSKERIKLPVDEFGKPDFTYMELYITNLKNEIKSSLKILNNIVNHPNKKLNLSRFKRFHLYDNELFKIDAGTKLNKAKMSNKSPSINFVGRANSNNGVTAYIDKIDGLEPYKAGYMTLSLGGEYLGSCFIQDKPFYTSQNVNVLIPKREMSIYQKQYIATMIFKEGRVRYKAFIDELNRHIKTDFMIYLPVTKQGTIDWCYMEEYMKSLNNQTLDNFKKI